MNAVAVLAPRSCPLGGALIPSSTLPYWTSEKQGTKAWTVKIATDAGGAVIPLQSGATFAWGQGSFIEPLENQ